MKTGLKNSAIIGIVQTLGQIVLASMAGYGLAGFLPPRQQGLLCHRGHLMIPGAVTFIPVTCSSPGWAGCRPCAA